MKYVELPLLLRTETGEWINYSYVKIPKFLCEEDDN